MKRVVWLVIVISGCIVFTWLYYNKPHREPSSEVALYISADSLFTAFVADETTANINYLNKVLAVKGEVIDISTNEDHHQVIMLASSDPLFGINCTMDTNDAEIVIGDSVTLIGICTGFLSDVVLVQCQLKN